MLGIVGYRVLEIIYQGQNSTIYLGTKTEGPEQQVIIKVPTTKLPNDRGAEKLQHEFTVNQQINSNYVLKYKELISHAIYGYVLIEEAGQMRALSERIPEKGFASLPFLQLALQLAEGLCDIHRSNIIHNDIKPSNIIIRTETPMTLQYIDFGSASPLQQIKQIAVSSYASLGTLAYISPEQTGRVNRLLDYRTDFYSLGVTFYQLLCGKLPFKSKDALKLIHCHIAQQPRAPHHIKADIPLPLSDIIMKLLKKDPEERYQSAYGLLEDLRYCLQELLNKGEIPPFPLAQKDVAEHFYFPQKLYGREKELERLIQAFTRTQQGKPEVYFITGYAGTGKSMLVNELQPTVNLQKGYFLTGKFDQMSCNLAYSAIRQAFQGWVKQILAYEEEKILLWKQSLLEGLGNQGQVLIDMIPELELLLGKQPPLSPLDAEQAKNRFHLVFQHFMQTLAQSQHPLVLFLDDLQWADEASLKLLESLITYPEAQNLLFIGAYRGNEVQSTHPLLLMIKNMQRLPITIQTLELTNLALAGVNQYLADVFRTTPELIQPLAELVYKKTAGNPFFIKAFLQALHEQRLLTLTQGVWHWELDKIAELPVTENVIEFMSRQVSQLPVLAQGLLKFASCLGHQFTLQMLELVTGKTQQSLMDGLQLLTKGGFLLVTQNYYEFVHDRIQEAAYGLIATEQRASQHLAIGRLLQAKLPPGASQECLFEIVNHLNQGSTLICEPTEQLELAKLNLIAGKKAKAAIAYAVALDYLQTAANYLARQDIWQENYALAYDLYKELAEAEYLNGHFEASIKYANFALTHAQTAVEKAEICSLLMIRETLQAHYQEAINLGYQALNLLGIQFQADNLAQLLEVEIKTAKENLQDKTVETILNAAELQRADINAILKLLNDLTPAAFFTNQTLHNLLVTKSVNLSLTYGNSKESITGYVLYGELLCAKLNNIKLGYQFGLVAIQLSARFQALAYQCRSNFSYVNNIHHWAKPLRQGLAFAEAAQRSGLEAGELQYLGYISQYQALNFFYTGIPLNTVYKELNKYLVLSYNTNNQLVIATLHAIRLVVLNLMSETEESLLFHDTNQGEDEYQAAWQREKHFYALANYLVLKAQALYLHGHFAQALEILSAAKNHLAFIPGHISIAAYNYYYSLILLALYPTAGTELQSSYWQQLAANQAQMNIWAEHCPENFSHKYLLIAAEMARIQGKDQEAAEYYDQAIHLAQQQDFMQEQALACELAAKFWLAKNQSFFAQIFLHYAHNSYISWGAKRKIKLLRKQYPDLLKPTFTSHLSSFSISNERTISAESLALIDLASVLKASQAISREIDLTKLLSNIMVVMVENAGAQLGAFWLVEESGELLLQAEYTLKGKIKTLQQLPLAQWETGAHTLIEHVQRTCQPILLEEANQSKEFNQDPYMSQQQIRSVLCLPIVLQKQLKAILYLENNLLSHAFTEQHLQILMMLASQMAISLENAQSIQKQLKANRQIAEEQSRRAEEAENYHKKQEKFIDTICHEIRNPILGIYGNLELLEEAILALKKFEDNAKQLGIQLPLGESLQKLEEGSRIITQCAEHQKSIVDDVLQLSQLKAGKATLTVKAFQPKTIIEDTSRMFANRLSAKKLKLLLSLPPEPLTVSSDPERFKIILMNLLSNALKFTEQGTISVNLQIQTTNATAPLLMLEVKDTGVGLTPQEQAQLFHRFNRPLSSQYEGSGLGLTIVRKSIHLLGGSIQVKSEKGQGTQFTIQIPCQLIRQGETAQMIARESLQKPLPAPTQPIAEIPAKDKVSNPEKPAMQKPESTAEVKNAAVKLFLGEGSERESSCLAFKTWYHPDICHYLLQMADNRAHCIRVTFHDVSNSNNTQIFKDQLLTLITLANKLQKFAIFISKEPGADNHFVCGLIKANQLLFINPLGMTKHDICYQTLVELQKTNVLARIWLSSSTLQRKDYEEEGLVSCGPISLELAIHIVSDIKPMELENFWQGLLNLKEPSVHERSGLVYDGTPIRNLLPATLTSLSNIQQRTAYEQCMVDIRQKHYQQLNTLPIAQAQAKKLTVAAYLSKLKESAPAQMVFNVLMFGGKVDNKQFTILNIEELPAYQQLMEELNVPVTGTNVNVEQPPLKHILLVEDNKINQKILHKQLQTKYTCATADNGEEAVKKYASEPFDFIFMDLEMPVMNGIEATKAIRAREKELNLPPIPIVALSAYPRGSQHETDAKAAGMNDYLSKPYQKEKLFETIERLTVPPQTTLEKSTPEVLSGSPKPTRSVTFWKKEPIEAITDKPVWMLEYLRNALYTVLDRLAATFDRFKVEVAFAAIQSPDKASKAGWQLYSIEGKDEHWAVLSLVQETQADRIIAAINNSGTSINAKKTTFDSHYPTVVMVFSSYTAMALDKAIDKVISKLENPNPLRISP